MFAFVGLGLLAVSLHAQDLVGDDWGTPANGSVVVTGENVTAYGSPDATTATKTDTPVLDIPQSITTIPRQLIDDQGDVTVDQAIGNVASVTIGGPYRDFDEYRIRGFNENGHTFLDGLTLDTEINFQEELFGLDRVEVLQGPASVLYGEGPAGGLINLISKTPAKESFTRLTLEGGSYGEFEAGVDTDAPLNASGTIYGRINLAYHQLGEFTDGVDPSRRLFFAPSLTIDLTSNTRITFLGQFYEEWQNLGAPLPAVGTVLPNVNGNISIFRNIGEPDTFPFRTDARRVQAGYQLEHRFNGIFTLRQNLRFAYHEADFRGILGYALDADERTLERYTLDSPDVYQTLGLDTSLEAKFATGPSVNQTALVGVDFYYIGDHFKDIEGSIASIDLFHPKYGAQPYDVALDVDEPLTTTATGIYFQDQIELFRRVTIVVGGRGDFVSNDTNYRPGDNYYHAFDTAFSPRAGIVYEVVPKTISTYFSYSRSFLSNAFDIDPTGKLLPPENGEQYEVGVKADAFNGRLSGLLALYDITRTNVPTPDPLNPNFSEATGEERHRGVDFNTNFTPAKGWDVIASYALIDARITKDSTPGEVGDHVYGVPADTVSLWTRYTLQRGPLRGLGGGAGFRYLTNQAGDLMNTFNLPSYGVLDLALYYARGPFTAQANVDNATNEHYFSGSYSRFSVEPGDPITVRSSIRWNF
jgi:iron complex outermembrane receptor protein